MKSMGIYIPHDMSALGLYGYFSPTWAPKAARGGLVFFGKDREDITHVGVCLDNKFMLEAGGGDSRVRTVADAKIRNAFVRISPITRRADLVSALHPNA